MTRLSVVLLLTLTGASCDKSPLVSAPTSAQLLPPAALDDDAYIKGTVSDTAYRLLPGARVEVLDGPHAGTSTFIDARGEFTMNGAFEEGTTFRATKAGYITATGQLQPSCARCHPHRWIHFYLQVPDPPVSIAGNYTLTFIADGACTTLPSELRTRTYEATITGYEPRPDTWFEIIVNTGEIEDQGGGAAVAGNFVFVGFGDPGLVEEVAPLTYLSYYGGISVTVPESPVSTISGPFDGTIDYCVLKSEPGDYNRCQPEATHVRCLSNNHRIILTRR